MASTSKANKIGDGTVKKIRNPNWSNVEEKALVEAVETCYDTLFGAHSNKVTEEVKQGLWVGVCEKVTSKLSA